MYRLNHCIRSAITKYLVQWDKEENFGRSQVGVGVTHANAAEWSEVVVDTKYQVRRLWPMRSRTNLKVITHLTRQVSSSVVIKL